MKPTTAYAGIGFIVGMAVGFAFAGKLDIPNLLVGALIGAFVGLFLAVSKYKLWDRK